MKEKTVYIGAFIVVTDATIVLDSEGFATVTGNLLPDEDIEGDEPVEVEFWLHKSQLVVQDK